MDIIYLLRFMICTNYSTWITYDNGRSLERFVEKCLMLCHIMYIIQKSYNVNVA